MTGFFQVAVEGNVDALYDEANSGGGSFPPLPAGKYQATVVPLKNDGSQLVEVVPFSNKPEYAGKQAVRVAVRILEASPTGAKRTFFDRIPLFTQFPSGKPARTYWDFFGAVGATPEQLKAGQVPGPDQILGKQVTITLSKPQEPNEYNELGFNEVNWYAPAGALESTPRRVPGVAVASWLTPDDQLVAGFAAAQPAAAAPQQQPWSQPAVNPFGSAGTEESVPQGGGTVTPGPWANQGTSPLQQAADQQAASF